MLRPWLKHFFRFLFLSLFCIKLATKVLGTTNSCSQNFFVNKSLQRMSQPWASEGGRRGAKASLLDFEIISKKRLFFQFRGAKNKFHHFCPPLEKILGKFPTGPPLEKILPTPMGTALNTLLAYLPERVSCFCSHRTSLH